MPATKRAQSLALVLKQSEHINELIRQAAEELSCLNTNIKRELATSNALLGVENDLKKSTTVANKLHEAFEKIAVVNQALEHEVRERTLVDHQLAAAEEQEATARHMAFHDTLTGLPNRALFNDRLEHGIAQATRHHWILAVLFVDVDKFKSINDSSGHAAGDTVLQTLATRLREKTRNEDTISRLGGDEFMCLLTEIHEEKDVARIAAKILEAIRAPCNVGSPDPNINPSIEASIGIAIFPKDGATADALIKSADTAMYRAKHSKSGYAFAQ